MENSPLLITDYNPETKTIDVVYYLLKDNPNTYQIINIQEKEKPNAIWADGATDYTIRINTELLPKKFVEIVSPVDGINGYYIFRLPYWMYKKDMGLQIKRLKELPKRFTSPKDDTVKLFGNKSYQEALEGTGTDMKKVMNVYNGLFGPKPEKPTSDTQDNTNSQSSIFSKPGKTYWGD